MIQKLLDEKLQEKQDARKDRKGSGKITPSSLGKCFRFQFWKRRGEAPSNPIDARTLRVFQAGSLFHDFVQDLLPEHQVEVKVETDDILGYADIVTEDTVIDLKSQHSRAFWYMKKDGYDVKEEKFNNWLQLACYGKLLNKKKLQLVLISKDDLCISEYVEQTKNWAEPLEDELASIRGWWLKRTLPPAQPRAYKGKECQYCSFRNKCKELEG